MYFLSGSYWSRETRSGLHQDSLTIQQMTIESKYASWFGRKRCLMAVLCDGVGGLTAGEKASGYVTEACISWFYGKAARLIRDRCTGSAVKRSFCRMLYMVDEELRQYGSRKGILFGTTVMALFIIQDSYYLIYMGDSRCYLAGKAGNSFRYRQLTRDRAAGSRLAGLMGSFRRKPPYCIQGKIRGEKDFLLCSHSFYRKGNLDKMWEAFCIKLDREAQIEKRLNGTAAYLREEGETDDISAIYIRAGRRSIG